MATEDEVKNETEPGEIPANEPVTLETLKAQLDEKEKHIKTLNKENADRRKKLESFEKAEADRKAADMTEIEKVNQKAAELEKAREALASENRLLKLQQAFHSQARALSVSFVNETAGQDAFSALNVEIVGDDLRGMKDAIEQVMKDRPYLFGNGASQAQAVTDGGKKSPASLKEVNQQEIINRKRSQYAPL